MSNRKKSSKKIVAPTKEVYEEEQAVREIKESRVKKGVREYYTIWEDGDGI
jgi:hypothetical protein